MSPIKYFKEVGSQMKRVRWPKFSTFISSFSVILVIIVIASVILWLETFAGIQIMEQLKESFTGIGA
jgi:preprotein translocase SecE subunit